MENANNLYNFNAEQGVLGAMIRNENIRSEALGALESSDFYEKNISHINIFIAISHLVDSLQPVDFASIVNELKNMKAFESSGGVEYLTELSETFISEKNAMRHINIVKDYSLVRKFLNVIKSVENEYNNKKITSISDYIGESERKILEVTKTRRVGEFQSTKEVVEKIAANLKINQGKKINSYVTGLDTGFETLNKFTQGFHPGQLIILAARPSVGKTAFAINLAYYVASLNNKTVAFFSLEMSAEDIVTRLLSFTSHINSRNLTLGRLNNNDWLALAESINAIKKLNILIDDTSAAKLNDIKAKCKKLKAQDENLGAIFIDYLGLITTNNTKLENHQLEIGEISRSLKALARDLEIPIICLCQLSRASEKRAGDKSPVLSDLRDSGSIEQDADMVMFLHRPNYQKNEELRKKAQQEQQANKEETGNELDEGEETQLLLSKNRNGQTGLVPLTFFMNIGMFVSREISIEEGNK